jgi:hypothetical protein
MTGGSEHIVVLMGNRDARRILNSVNQSNGAFRVDARVGMDCGLIRFRPGIT